VRLDPDDHSCECEEEVDDCPCSAAEESDRLEADSRRRYDGHRRHRDEKEREDERNHVERSGSLEEKGGSRRSHKYGGCDGEHREVAQPLPKQVGFIIRCIQNRVMDQLAMLNH